jgi:ferric-dicitrate binding protein FerR (iron transport regulator)
MKSVKGWKGWKVRKVSERENQLEWTAFCYASGDLSPAEAEQFEMRLEGDQEAREALARAVELTQVVAANAVDSARPADGGLVSTWGRRGCRGWRSAVWGLVLAMVWSGGLSQLGMGRKFRNGANDALASAGRKPQAMSETSDVGPLHPLNANSEATTISPGQRIACR